MVDLHTHSTYSDGTFTPEELVAQAKKIGLSALALTDHNTLDGLPRFLKAAENAQIEGVPGVEISTAYMGTALHLVALFVKPQHEAVIQGLLDQIEMTKTKSNLILIERLQEALHADITYEKIVEQTGAGSMNRANIAQYLYKKGLIPSVKAGFETILHPKKGYYVPPDRLNILEVTETLSKIGLVTVLAHPFVNLTEIQLDCFLPLAKAQGLTAIETYYSTYTPEQVNAAKKLAKKYGLKESGGSDFHGENKPDIKLGVGRGSLAVPQEVLHLIRCP